MLLGPGQGKSFIIMKMAQYFVYYKKFVAYIIVPTKALKNQYEDYKKNYIEKKDDIHVILPHEIECEPKVSKVFLVDEADSCIKNCMVLPQGSFENFRLSGLIAMKTAKGIFFFSATYDELATDVLTLSLIHI